MPRKSILPFLQESFRHFSSHRASRMGAALSYYAIFSIVPLCSVIIAIAGYSLGRNYIQTALTSEIAKLIGPESAELIRSVLLASTHTPAGIAISVASAVVLIIGTLGMLRELKDSMDDLWNAAVPEKRARGWGYFVRSRLISLSVIPVLIVLLLVSLTWSAAINFAGVDTDTVFKICSSLFTTVIVSLLFAFIYRYLPNRKLPWKETLSGAFSTALLFLAGKLLIGAYIHWTTTATAFGTAGAFIVILLWVYYSAQIFFLGASMTYVWSERHGHLGGHS
jgi:membrane protein